MKDTRVHTESPWVVGSGAEGWMGWEKRWVSVNLCVCVYIGDSWTDCIRVLKVTST